MNLSELERLQSQLRILQNMAFPSQQIMQMANSAYAAAELMNMPTLEAMRYAESAMCASAKAAEMVFQKYEQLNKIANATYESSAKMAGAYNSPMFKIYDSMQNFMSFYEINPAIQSIMNFADTHQNFIDHFYNKNVWLLANSFKAFENVPFAEHTTYIENVLSASSEFSQEERNLILDNAGSSLPKPCIDFELSGKILALLKTFFPAFFLKDFDAKAAKTTIVSITATIAFLFNVYSFIQSHIDAEQAHSDSLIEQKQNDEKIKLLREISEQNKELLKIHKETATHLKNDSLDKPQTLDS